MPTAWTAFETPRDSRLACGRGPGRGSTPWRRRPFLNQGRTLRHQQVGVCRTRWIGRRIEQRKTPLIFDRFTPLNSRRCSEAAATCRASDLPFIECSRTKALIAATAKPPTAMRTVAVNGRSISDWSDSAALPHDDCEGRRSVRL